MVRGRGRPNRRRRGLILSAAAQPETGKGRRWKLGVCGGTHILHDGMVDMLYPLLPFLAQAFGLSYSEVGFIRAANKAAMALFQLPIGLLAERFGERLLLAAGTACAGIAYVLLGFAESYLTIVGFLFLAGFGNAVQHPLCSAIVSNAYSDGSRRSALGTYNFAGDVGKLAFASAASFLIGIGVSWDVPVQSTGVIGIAAAILVFVFLGPSKASGHMDNHVGNKDNGRSGGWGIRDRTGFFALCGIAVLDSSTRTGFLTFVAFLMIAKGVPEGWAASATVMVFAGGMVGKLACGLLADRFGVIRTVVLTEIATGIGILLTLVLPNLAAFFLLPFIGVALNGTSSVLYGTIGDLVESDRQGRAFGLFYTLGSVCGILAPWGYGFLGDLISIPTTIAVVGCAIFLTIPLCLVLRSSVGEAKAATSG
jgi:FSR family fosmidomycin resistance protein-like MFS transporter